MEPSRSEPYTVALAQFRPELGDIGANLELLADYQRRALDAGADLLVTPELGLSGYRLRDLASEVYLADGEGPERNRQWYRRLEELGGRIPTVASFPLREGDSLHIAAGLTDGDGVRGVHRKVYLPTYGLFEDARFFDRGESTTVVDTGLGKLGLLICEDAWHPTLVNLTALAGAGVLVILSASPVGGANREMTYSADWWRRFSIVYAKLFGCWVLFANRTGSEDGVIFSGASRVVDSLGRVVAEADGEEGRPEQLEDGLITAEIKPELVFRAREELPLIKDEDPRLMRELFDKLPETSLPVKEQGDSTG